MSEGNPTTTPTTTPSAEAPKPKPTKTVKVVRHVHENAPAATSSTPAKKSEGSVLGTIGGAVLGLAIGAGIAFGVVQLVKHSERIKAFFSGRRDAPPAQ